MQKIMFSSMSSTSLLLSFLFPLYCSSVIYSSDTNLGGLIQFLQQFFFVPHFIHHLQMPLLISTSIVEWTVNALLKKKMTTLYFGHSKKKLCALVTSSLLIWNIMFVFEFLCFLNVFYRFFGWTSH